MRKPTAVMATPSSAPAMATLPWSDISRRGPKDEAMVEVIVDTRHRALL
jgi:hypothetical protein